MCFSHFKFHILFNICVCLFLHILSLFIFPHAQFVYSPLYPVCMFIPPFTQFVCLFPPVPSLYVYSPTYPVCSFSHIPSLYIYSPTYPVCTFIPPHTQFVHLFLHTPSLYVYSSTHPDASDPEMMMQEPPPLPEKTASSDYTNVNTPEPPPVPRRTSTSSHRQKVSILSKIFHL